MVLVYTSDDSVALRSGKVRANSLPTCLFRAVEYNTVSCAFRDVLFVVEIIGCDSSYIVCSIADVFVYNTTDKKH